MDSCNKHKVLFTFVFHIFTYSFLFFVGKPSSNSIWTVTNLGDIFVWDSSRLQESQLKHDAYVQEIDLAGKEVPLKIPLHTPCVPGLRLTLTGCIGDEADRIAINLDAAPTFKLKHKAYAELENCCFHLNPRFPDNCVVRNSMIDGKWGEEERDGAVPFVKGQEFELKIECRSEDFVVFVNNRKFVCYRHRIHPSAVVGLSLKGMMQPFKLRIESPDVILAPLNLYWRQLGGHLRRIETCALGITWGIAYDHTAWVYTGGWGGGFYGALDSHLIFPMTDSQDYRVYENQRWNPVSGYSSSGTYASRLTFNTKNLQSTSLSVTY